MTVTTCLAADAPKGSRLTFESSGKLKDTSVVAAQKGTTVHIEKLFHNLPVRRRELEKNIKREWHKVITLLNQYACIQTNMKFSVSQQPTKGKKILLFSTKGNPTTRENIINIFGAKTMSALIPLELSLEMRPSTLGPALQTTVDARSISSEVRVVGHVSRPTHGEGRQTPDRQMFFVNGRPCGLPQFSKAFNEVYKTYNTTQAPFVFADIQLDTHMYDVNVSPDKRTILLHDQQHLLDGVRASLADAFDSQEYSLPAAQPSMSMSITGESRAGTTAADSPGQGYLSSNAETYDSAASELQPSSSRTAGTATRSTHASAGKTSSLLQRWVRRDSSTEDVHLNFRAHHRASSKHTNSGETGANTASSDSESDSDSGQTSGSDGEGQRSEDGQLHSTLIHQGTEKRQSRDYRLEDGSNTTASGPGPALVLSPSQKPPSNPEVAQIPTVKLFKPSAHGDNILTRKKLRQLDGEPAVVDIGPTASAPRLGEHQFDPLRRNSKSGSSTGKNAAAGLGDSRFPSGLDTSARSATESDESASAQLFEEPETYEDARRVHSPVLYPKPCSSDVEAQSSGESDSEVDVSLQSNRTKLSKETGDKSPEQEVQSTTELTARSRILELQNSSRRKDTTFALQQSVTVDVESLQDRLSLDRKSQPYGKHISPRDTEVADISAADAESKLSLIISKSDFARMRVVGQFNMGFILAIRPTSEAIQGDHGDGDELFIIDQHASDEKYNFERLQSTTVVQSQRLVNPKRLELTAVEEEVITHNAKAIEANGFKIDVQADGSLPVGSRCLLTSLPLSRETTFDVPDLEELISLLGDESSETTHVPRPSKVRKMFAMRACRSSIMIGKALTRSHMYNLVGHMGELDKPWNCPHGRPTMRHLCRLEVWDDRSWAGDLASGPASLWTSFVGSC